MEQSLVVLLNVDVDGEMGIDVSHLVFVTLGHADDKVLDDGLDGSEGSDVLSGAMVDFDSHQLLTLLVLGDREGDRNVGKIFGEFS